MNQPQEPRKRKKFPGGLFLLMLVTLLVILTVQSLADPKNNRVSFSHQVEHLVNLDLVNASQTKKVAQQDNLVTFSGQFQEELSDTAKVRYRYLELLNEHHNLQTARRELLIELSDLEARARAAGTQFLHLSGLPVPVGGYILISPQLDTPDKQNSLILGPVEQARRFNLELVASEMQRWEQVDPTPQQIIFFQQRLLNLVDGFESPMLGIGVESLKQELRKMRSTLVELGQTQGGEVLVAEQEQLFGVLGGLEKLVRELNRMEQGVRLAQLRSVRSYLIDLEKLGLLGVELQENGALLGKARQQVGDVTWFFNDQELSSKMLEKESPDQFALWFTQTKQEWTNFDLNRGQSFKAPDQPRNLVLDKRFKSEEPSPNYLKYILLTIMPIVLLVFLFYFLFARQMKGMGSGAMNFGKSPARLLNQAQQKVTFKDVAGVDEAMEELFEVVDFLKDPDKFTALGARIPRGVLLVGAPGTGKTLIARATAGEADRPFFSISGSDFVEMFVGVGASRIRDLFAQAKKSAPCIVFIDEIDAVGGKRGSNLGGGGDHERDQTLNQLLVEMDGFEMNEGVILVAATNRPDVLDPALLRPGRFDRRVTLDLPDLRGRLAILKIHAKKIKLDGEVNLLDIAQATPGNAGADLMNILNEGAILAACKGRGSVTPEDLLFACDKVLYGKERKSLERDQKDQTETAYHEAGHAVVGYVLDHVDPVKKVTIIPRGNALGATYMIPEKNKLSYWKKEIQAKLAVLMGGRIAEEVFLGDLSSGACSDIEAATQLAESMVCEWGMTKFGSISYSKKGKNPFGLPTTQPYSDETAQRIDHEIHQLLEEANNRARQVIAQDYREQVEQLAKRLLEFETLDGADVEKIMTDKFDPEEKRSALERNKGAHIIPPPAPPQVDQEQSGGLTQPAPQQG